MSLSQEWLKENITDEKYLEQLKKLYPNHDLEKLLLLNIDLRLLYLKHIFMIENSLKSILLQQMDLKQIQNLDNSNFINQDHLKNLRKARRVIRAGYHKYSRNGVLKSKTIRSLIEVMSFEAIMNLLHTLTDDNLKQIAAYFGILEHNNRHILLEQLNFIKDVRNYLSHNFKVLGVYFNQKHFSSKNNGSNGHQQDLTSHNNQQYLHSLLDKLSSKNQLLEPFSSEYKNLFQKYNINLYNNGAK